MQSNQELIDRTVNILKEEMIAYIDGKMDAQRMKTFQCLIDHLNAVEARQALTTLLVIVERKRRQSESL